MKLILIICILWSILKQFRCQSEGSIRDPRIINGSRVESGQFPYFAFLKIRVYGHPGALICGGSIIDVHWIVTAAHCVKDRKFNYVWKVEAYIGTTDRGFKSSEPLEIERSSIYIHESSYQLSHDIALLKLERAIEYTDLVKKIALPTQYEEEQFTRVTVMGFGETRSGDKRSDSRHLLKTEVVLVNSDKCKAVHFVKYIEENMLCAGNTGASDKSSDTCGGDSGGPLIGVRPNGEHVLLGITSYSDGTCGKPYTPAVYVRVSTFVNWINEKMTTGDSSNGIGDIAYVDGYYYYYYH